jgi:hypothetical protein
MKEFGLQEVDPKEGENDLKTVSKLKDAINPLLILK